MTAYRSPYPSDLERTFDGDDVAVIGASSPGLLSAALLARAGRQVTVYERLKDLDHAPRTLIVTGDMRDYIGPLGESAVVNEIHRFELFSNGHLASLRLGRPDLIVERSALIRALAKEADEAGAELNLGHRLIDLAPDARGVRLHMKNGHPDRSPGRTFQVVVGADGAFSSVARAAGWPRQSTLSLLQGIVRLPDDLRRDTARVWFRPDDTRYFYWLIPESETYGALGVIGEDPGELRDRLDRFMKERDLVSLEYQAACVPNYRRWTPIRKTVGGGQVYLVGDAAGQVKVTTVGGVVTGFRGAIVAVDSILGRKSTQRSSRLRVELEAHRLLRAMLNGFRESDYCALLDSLNDGARRALHAHSRDEASKLLWRLPVTQPRLILLALRGLLSSVSSR